MMSVAFLEISPYNKLKMYMCKKPKKNAAFEMPASSSSN